MPPEVTQGLGDVGHREAAQEVDGAVAEGRHDLRSGTTPDLGLVFAEVAIAVHVVAFDAPVAADEPAQICGAGLGHVLLDGGTSLGREAAQAVGCLLRPEVTQIEAGLLKPRRLSRGSGAEVPHEAFYADDLLSIGEVEVAGEGGADADLAAFDAAVPLLTGDVRRGKSPRAPVPPRRRATKAACL